MERLSWNDALFRTIWERAADAMVLTDQDGIVLTANPAYCQLYGYTADDIQGQHFTIGFLPEDRDRVAAQYQAMFAGEAPLHVFENVIRRADGARRTIETRAEFLSHEDQRYAMLSIIRDITERKQSELALRAQTETLQSINRIGRLLSAELDLQKLVQAVTDAATELTGAAFGSFFYNLTDDRGERYTLYTLSGAPREAFANFPMPRNTHVFGPTFRGEGIIRLDNVKQDPRYGQNPPFSGMPQGHLPVTSYLAVPVISRSGEVLGGLFFGHPEPGVFGEQTEQLVAGLAAQAAIAMDNARLYQQAQAAIRIRDQFLSIASHELKTPLTSLFGHAQLLEHRTARMDVLPERERRSVRVIVDQASRLNTMIADLLDISRIELGQLRIEQKPVDLAGLTRQVVEEVIPSLERHTISASVEAAPLIVRGDALRLEQVVQNLISNAIKYSPQGRQVTVQVARCGPQACVAVSDEGIGIPKSELPRLFNRFYRATNVEMQRINGMGIGLYVVKEVVTLHGGTVTVESVEGQGSTFTVCLPLIEPERKRQTVDK